MDGDEMSAWLPGSWASVAELVECAGTEAVVKTSEDGRLIQVLKQDALTGGYMLTVGHAHGKPLDRGDFYQCCMLMKSWTLDWILYRLVCYGREVLRLNVDEIESFRDLPDEVFTGHSLLSLLFPPTFCFDSFKSDAPPPLVIKRGLIHSGVFNKSVLSEHRGGMLHLYESIYGARAVIEWISAYQILVVQRLSQFGFSIGMKDTELVGAEVESVIERDKRTSWIEAREAWMTNDRMSEVRVSTALNNIKALGEKVTKQFLNQMDSVSVGSNGIITAIASGAKGSYANVASMTVMVGQQNLEGKRMPMIFGGELGARTLPCYLGEEMYRERINESDNIFDRVLESRGRVVSPYRNGLTPQEYFFCAMAGREGMIDTVSSAHTHCEQTINDVQNPYLTYSVCHLCVSV
jgi:DNA-directed RNA polymerase beta' subunit